MMTSTIRPSDQQSGIIRKPLRIFYGWWVVVTAAIALTLGPAPVVVFSFSVFLKPGAGIDRTGSYLFSLMTLSIAALVAAVFVARLGPYRYAPPEAGVYGATAHFQPAEGS